MNAVSSGPKPYTRKRTRWVTAFCVVAGKKSAARTRRATGVLAWLAPSLTASVRVALNWPSGSAGALKATASAPAAFVPAGTPIGVPPIVSETAELGAQPSPRAMICWPAGSAACLDR